MLKIVKILLTVIIALAGVVIIKNNPATSQLIWSISNEGAWLLPLVVVAAVLDSVHPCSFSILFITIAFLFGMQMERKNILEIGGAYIGGIFIAYLFIGLGILKVLHLFDTPHFMGKLGAGFLIAFGVLNIVNEFFPKFPIKLRIPDVMHSTMGKLMRKTSFLAAFILGVLVGICQFPCMGGPYLMVIGLLRDQMTYSKGFAYLLLYNIILIAPLVTVLWIAADKVLLEKMQEWKISNVSRVKLWAGLAMIAMGIVILNI